MSTKKSGFTVTPRDDGSSVTLGIYGADGRGLDMTLNATQLANIVKILIDGSLRCAELSKQVYDQSQFAPKASFHIPALQTFASKGQPGYADLSVSLGLFQLSFEVPAESIHKIGQELIAAAALQESNPSKLQ